MPAIIILAVIVGISILYFVITPLIKKGETESLFLIDDEKDLFVLVLMNIEVLVMSKRGSYIIHRYRLKKINVRTGQVIFNTHYKKIYATLLQSYVRILGCNTQYAYLTSAKKDISVFDLNSGEKIADRKYFAQQGIYISDQDWTFDKEKGALVVYDKQGSQYVINGTEIAKTNSFQPNNETATVINVFDSLKFSKHDNFMMHIRRSLDHGDPAGLQIELKEIPGSKRSFVHVSDFFDTTQPNENGKDSFIKPMLLRLDKEHFLVKHQLTMDDNQKEVFLSLVNLQSKELWKLHKNEVVTRSLMDKPFNLYVIPRKGQLMLVWIDTGAKEFSISIVSNQAGEVLMKPAYFRNKKVG